MLREAAVSVADVTPELAPARAWRFVFSFPVMLAMLLVVLAVLTVRERFNDPDLWWHLKTGEIIWNTHSIPRVDLFSFTTNHHPWTAHEWLSQVIIYGAYKFGGYTGLMLWLCVFASLLFIAEYALCWLYSGNAKVAFLGGLVTFFFSTVGLAIRPQMIGYLLLVLELLILHLARSRNSRWFMALPPLFAVWVNCHGSFLFGLMVLAVVLFCAHVDLHWGLLVSRRSEPRQRRTLTAAFAISIAALFVNPIGLKQVLYPLDVFLNQHVGLAQVTEWQPIDLNDPRALGLFGLAGLILLVTMIRVSELQLRELLLLALGFGLAVRHQRMLFVFGILAAPILCRLLANAWDRYDPAKDRPRPNAIMILLSLVAVVLGFPNALQLEEQVKKSSPVKAVEFIRQAGLSGRMLNEYVYGGYLIWAAPDHKVFVDGRADVYEWTGVLADFGKWATLQTEPNILLDHYRIGFCLLLRASPMSQVLPLLPGWKKIYSDDQSVIFVRPGATSAPSTGKSE